MLGFRPKVGQKTVHKVLFDCTSVVAFRWRFVSRPQERTAVQLLLSHTAREHCTHHIAIARATEPLVCVIVETNLNALRYLSLRD